MASARFLVSGRVQGVFFRASTKAQAHALGLVGHVRNLDDGSVEVVASGSTQALASLQRWLHEGPANACVESVVREDIATQTHDDFAVR